MLKVKDLFALKKNQFKGQTINQKSNDKKFADNLLDESKQIIKYNRWQQRNRQLYTTLKVLNKENEIFSHKKTCLKKV